MGKYNKTIITEQGLELLNRAKFENKKLIFTQAKAFSDYDMKSIIKSANCSDVIVNDINFEISAIYTNETITNDSDVNCIGLYAKIDNSNEILFSYSTAINPTTIIAYDGINPITYEFYILSGITQLDNITLEITQAGLATKEDLLKKWTKYEVETKELLPLPSKETIGVDKLFYVKDENKHYQTKQISDISYSKEEKTYTSGTLENRPVATSEAIYNAIDVIKWFKSIINEIPLNEIEYITLTGDLPVKGTYVNGTYIYKSDTQTLHLVDATVSSGYIDLTNFEIVDNLDNLVNDTYYYNTTDSKLYYYAEYIWQEIEVNEVAEEPTWNEETSGKYYLLSNTLLYLGITIMPIYQWVSPQKININLFIVQMSTISSDYEAIIDSAGKTYYKYIYTNSDIKEVDTDYDVYKGDTELVDMWDIYDDEFLNVIKVDVFDGYAEIFIKDIPANAFSIKLKQ